MNIMIGLYALSGLFGYIASRITRDSTTP